MIELFSLFSTNLIIVLAVLGALAFVVSVITEVTKNIGFLAKIPTDSQVIFVAIMLCQVSYFGYASYFSLPFRWYYIVGCFIAAFIVAFISMYGWEKLTILYNRFKSPGGKL